MSTSENTVLVYGYEVDSGAGDGTSCGLWVFLTPELRDKGIQHEENAGLSIMRKFRATIPFSLIAPTDEAAEYVMSNECNEVDE